MVGTPGKLIKEQPARPICKQCNLSLAKPNGISKNGFQQWHKYCVECAKMLYSKKHKYLQNKKLKCEQCGFTAQDLCQLELVYKDGDKKNKREANLKTFCANCARLFKKKQRYSKKTLTVDADIRIN